MMEQVNVTLTETIKVLLDDKFTAGIPNNVCWSIIQACNGGNTEPPRIAIIKPAAPNLASSPKPRRAMP